MYILGYIVLLQVTFYPDLSKFAMDSLDRDTVALMKRRAYDIAATSPGVTVRDCRQSVFTELDEAVNWLLHPAVFLPNWPVSQLEVS